MIIPVEYDIVGVKGSPFDIAFKLYSDKKLTTPYNPVGEVTFEFWQNPVASVGDGLTVDGNLITIHLDYTKTNYSRISYRLKLIDSFGQPVYPIRGEITFETP